MSGKQYDDTDRGALFKNDRKETEKHPDYKGSLNVGGHDYWISAWIKDSRDGKKYMSLSVQQKDGKPAPVAATPRQSISERATPQPRRSMKDEMDDEIPF
jgi:uncharacterized protein (DUF736 family)